MPLRSGDLSLRGVLADSGLSFVKTADTVL